MPETGAILVAHKHLIKTERWTVSEPQTGLCLMNGRTFAKRGEALGAARAKILSAGFTTPEKWNA